MSDPNTITIPADLWGIFRDLREVRAYQASLLECGGEHVAGAALLRHLADEIERQAPRPQGWYSVRYMNGTAPNTKRFLRYWDGTDWRYEVGGAKSGIEPSAIIERVTIGDPS